MDAIDEFHALADAGDPATRWQYALALARTGEFQQARDLVGRPENVYARNTLARILRLEAARDPARAGVLARIFHKPLRNSAWNRFAGLDLPSWSRWRSWASSPTVC